jgi:predicted nucleic acid-binding protein
VTAFLDTNVLVRHFTGDPPELAARATRFLADAEELLVPDLIVAEVVYVLESFYEVERPRVAELARAIVAFPAITVIDKELLLRAVEVYEVDGLDFAEAYLVASAERSGINTIASFDRSIDRVTTVRRIEPGLTP